MCEAVVPGCCPTGARLTNPLNVMKTSIICWVVSSVIVACPVPGEPVAGTSSAPVRLPDKVKVSALLAEAGSISTAANATNRDRIEMTDGDSFIFDSLAEVLDTGSVAGCSTKVNPGFPDDSQTNANIRPFPAL